MKSVLVAAVTFLCTFCSALLGAATRSWLPVSHRSQESQDIVRLGMGLVATMAALLLGLVIAAAKSSFDDYDDTSRASAANVLRLDRDLARYGPETKPIRDMLRQAVIERFELMWPSKGADVPSRSEPRIPRMEVVQAEILALAPANESQRWLRAGALDLTEDLLKGRWRIMVNIESVPLALVIVVVFWLTATFFSFGLYAPRNGTVITMYFLVALCVAAAVLLIFELESPLSGLITVSSAPWRYVIAHLGT